nr:hypothetical protein [uncultured Hyphomonas sp.]
MDLERVKDALNEVAREEGEPEIGSADFCSVFEKAKSMMAEVFAQEQWGAPRAIHILQQMQLLDNGSILYDIDLDDPNVNATLREHGADLSEVRDFSAATWRGLEGPEA